MADFYDFVEHWAEIYKPMQHIRGKNSKNERFFLTDTYMGLSDFMTNVQPQKSPCVIMETNLEGNLTEQFDTPRYTIYFMVRSDRMVDGREAKEAKSEAKEHMLKFFTYLKHRQDMGMFDVRNIKLENTDYQTIGPLYNGWYGVTITLQDVESIDRCISYEDYLEV